MTLDQAKQMDTAHCSKHKRELEVIYYCPECDEEINSSQPKVQLAEVKKEFETIFLDGHNLDTLESEGFDQQDIDDIRELWTWFSNKLNKLSE